MTRDEMCRSLVDIRSEILDVLVHIAPERADSEEVRTRLASDFLLVAPEWHSAVERINSAVSDLLDEIHAAPEWTSTLDEVAREMGTALNRQLDEIDRRGQERNT